VSRPGLRVYFVTRAGGRLTGTLMDRTGTRFDPPPPSAFGASEEEVYEQLEARLAEQVATTEEADTGAALARYLWEEEFQTRQVAVEVHPQAARQGRTVIGRRTIPLRLTYAHCPMPGGHRVLLPRFGWRFVLEDLEIAPEVLRGAVATALLGDQPRTIYDFRHEGPEYVRAWSPRLLTRDGGERQRPVDEGAARPVLAAVADDLVERAARGRLPPLVGDLELPPDLVRRLQRDPPPSILLCGGPGVGKTAWVYRLARLLALWRREPDRPSRRLYRTSGDRLLAGMVYVGQWQERCLGLLRELSHEGDYLYLDRLGGIVRQQADGGAIADLLLPAARAGEISLIAECAPEELERLQRRLPQLLSTFLLVHVPEPPLVQMPELLVQYVQKKGLNLRVHPAGLMRAVQHLAAFQRDACFPGKGFRLLDWLGENARGRILYPREVSAAYARYSGLPVEIIADEVPAGAEEIAGRLGAQVIGQEEACRTCAQVLARFKAGLNDPGRPAGSFLFVGPTGVGKTELAKQLARYLFSDEARLVRLDMSEYMRWGSAARLLEAAEGAQSLARRVRQQPLCVVLLDEIEKAHPEVADLLLGVLGDGRLTDSQGRLVDFRGTLVIMTSNLGAARGERPGLIAGEPGDFLRAVRDHFRPELLGRIDHVITFRSLTPDDMLRIVDLELRKAATRPGLLRRGLTLDVRPEARQVLGRLGYDGRYGARPLCRVIEERLMTPLAVRLAAEPALRDRTITVTADDLLQAPEQ
jgi:ATP-dependent Clp protease ATP-binding subunit ClpC